MSALNFHWLKTDMMISHLLFFYLLTNGMHNSDGIIICTEQ